MAASPGGIRFVTSLWASHAGRGGRWWRRKTVPELHLPKPKTPLLAADCVVLGPRGRVLLVRRKFPPFRGQYALPGGFVEVGETVEAAARRELEEETGVKAGRLQLVGVYSDPKRDPRGHTCSAVFLVTGAKGRPKGGDDAAAAEWVADWTKVDLAFDHAKILADVRKLRRRQRPRRSDKAS